MLYLGGTPSKRLSKDKSSQQSTPASSSSTPLRDAVLRRSLVKRHSTSRNSSGGPTVSQSLRRSLRRSVRGLVQPELETDNAVAGGTGNNKRVSEPLKEVPVSQVGNRVFLVCNPVSQTHH